MQRRRTPTQRLLAYLTASIQINIVVEAELLLLAFATGMQDATTFPDYHCFASNQTGNTVLLAVGAAGIAGSLFSLPNIGVSLGLFVAGALIMGQLGHVVGGRRRVWLLVSNAVQTALVFAAAGLQYRGGSVVEAEGATAKGVIAMLAFSAGAQVAMARSTKIAEITTAMATAAWVDLLVDERLLAGRNRGRNRRALFLLSLFAGSFAGAFVYQRVGSAFALVISGVAKGVVLLAFCFNVEAGSEGVEGASRDGKRETTGVVAV
jgi:uncharacterized membrane protein YoaK (UPF0700 family)